jgi:hypothetical protein
MTRNAKPAIARIWCGRTKAARADEYAKYLYEWEYGRWRRRRWRLSSSARIGRVKLNSSLSYWESVEAMSRFAGKDPRRIHHLPRDPEFLIELPQSVQVLEIAASKNMFGSARSSE